MDVESLFAKAFGKRWPWYMQMHLVYFSRQTLPEMLRREGFQICEVSTHVRRVRLTYLASRFDAYSPTIGRLAGGLLDKIGLAERTVGVSFGDIFTVIARKPESA